MKRHEKLMAQTAFFKAILNFSTTNKVFVYYKVDEYYKVVHVVLKSNFDSILNLQDMIYKVSVNNVSFSLERSL